MYSNNSDVCQRTIYTPNIKYSPAPRSPACTADSESPSSAWRPKSESEDERPLTEESESEGTGGQHQQMLFGQAKSIYRDKAEYSDSDVSECDSVYNTLYGKPRLNPDISVPRAMPGCSSSSGSRAMPVTIRQRKPPFNRTLIEVCCGPDSDASKSKSVNESCECIRITESDDYTSESGLDKTNNAIIDALVLLLIALPCTGGCPWQRINV